jgi:hypothetical protein
VDSRPITAAKESNARIPQGRPTFSVVLEGWMP